MRHGSRFDSFRLPCSTALVGLALTAGFAQAQTRPGWVDPPARQSAETPAPEKTPAAREAKSSPQKSLAETPPVQETTQEAANAAAKETGRPERLPMATHRRRLANPETRRSAAPREEPAESLRVRPRIARMPAMAPSTASEADFPAWAAAATRLTDSYLDSVSGDGMVAAAPRFYAERVQFHGRSLSLAALIAEKSRFVRRWPVRRYEAQGGATHTACNAATTTCIVRTTFDFRAENPARGARSQGVSELTLTVSFAGPRPVIVAESSRVLRRYGGGPLSAIAGRQRGA